MASVPPLPKSFEDAARHLLAVEEELERVCGSSHFRTSKRSCEFLKYVVKVTLDGRLDSLKERSIGIDLFGRDTSYEPSSDATVRVRANEVRKRLSSYYASSSAVSELRIDLPTGSYIPRFLPAVAGEVQQVQPAALYPVDLKGRRATPLIVPLSSIALMRPALIALLVCTLLLRHQLESREEYLRFWDHLLSGRSAMVLDLPAEDRTSLASSLYPLVWVAGRYGVDATMPGDSLIGLQPDSVATIQVSYATAASDADSRLRWSLSSAMDGDDTKSGQAMLRDQQKAVISPVRSAALLTILPEDAATFRVQGTDAAAIRTLLEGLTVERKFPVGVAERIDNRHVFQILIFQDAAHEWHREVAGGSA